MDRVFRVSANKRRHSERRWTARAIPDDESQQAPHGAAHQASHDLRPNIPKTIHRGSTFLLLIRWPFHSSLVVEPGHLLLWLDLPTRTRSHLQVSHTPPNVFVTAKYLCSLTTQTQKSATTTPTGGNDLPRDRVAMREICQSLRTQSAQVSALQRQQDAGRSSFRGFLAEAESSAQHSLSLKLSEADQQYYQNYELKKQTM